MQRRWQIELFGWLRAVSDDRVVTRFRTQQTGELLAYLAYYRHRSHPRETLVELLWPGCDPAAGRHRLRTNLSSLRRQLEPPGMQPGRVLLADRLSIQLNPVVCETDVGRFEAALRAAASVADTDGQVQRLAEAVDLYRGELLPGYYADWIVLERRHHEQAYLYALEAIARAALDRDDLSSAERCLRRAIAVEPLRESAHRILIQVLMAAGNGTAACQIYETLQRQLRLEWNVDPDPETSALFRLCRARLNEDGDRRGAAADLRAEPGSGPRRREVSPGAVGRHTSDASFDRPPIWNLPVAPTPLVGRSSELAAVKALLRRSDLRLITLTGPGGIGKTRLAVEVGSELRDDFPHGVFFVDLAPLSDAGLVASTIASGLGIPEQSGQSIRDSLKQALQHRRLLLLLDNFEQVLEAASLVAELLAAAPKLKILTTSRTALRLRGEQEFPVPALTLPDPQRREPIENLTRYPGVSLFLQRVLAARPDFALTRENAPILAEICRRLEGVPLAIELAAPRMKLFPPQVLLSRLEEPLELLTRGARDLPSRQQTLHNTIAWSYNLLAEAEQRLLEALACFVGGFSLAAAEEVACPVEVNSTHIHGAPRTNLLDGITAIVEHSLLRQQEQADGSQRFAMLETIRHFGLLRLAEHGQIDSRQERHAHYFLEWVEEVYSALFGPQQTAVLAWLEREHDNLRAALHWFQMHRQFEAGMRLATRLVPFWRFRNHSREGTEQLRTLLEEAGAELSLSLRARCMDGLQVLTSQLGDRAAWFQYWEEAVRLSHQLGEKGAVANDLKRRATFAHREGDLAGGIQLMREALRAAEQSGERRDIFWASNDLGSFLLDRGDLAEARVHLERALALGREQGDARSVAMPLANLGSVALLQGDLEAAERIQKHALVLRRDLGHKSSYGASLEELAEVAVARGDFPRAARLFGAAVAVYEELGTVTDSLHQRIESTRAALGDDAFKLAWNEGHGMTFEDSTQYALAASASQ